MYIFSIHSQRKEKRRKEEGMNGGMVVSLHFPLKPMNKYNTLTTFAKTSYPFPSSFLVQRNNEHLLLPGAWTHQRAPSQLFSQLFDVISARVNTGGKKYFTFCTDKSKYD